MYIFGILFYVLHSNTLKVGQKIVQKNSWNHISRKKNSSCNEFLLCFYFRERPKILCNNSAEETAIQVNNPLAEAIRPVTVNPAMTCGATAWSPPPSSLVEVIPSGVRHQAPVEVTTANVIPPNYSLTSLVTFWENPPCK